MVVLIMINEHTSLGFHGAHVASADFASRQRFNSREPAGRPIASLWRFEMDI